MNLALRWIDPTTCEFGVGSRILARYAATPATPASESPKPSLHPVSTLKGQVVTDFRPEDHPWHHGIAWAFTYIDQTTFWGGPTFDRATLTYVWQQNQGRQEHRGWRSSADGSSTSTLDEDVDWLNPDGSLVVRERRRIEGTLLEADCWQLSFASEFRNATSRPISLESPVCHGRPEGGYFGLMWRGAPGWAHGELVTADPNLAAPMGQRSPWLAYRQSSTAPDPGTLLFVDHPANPRYPTQWFARCQDQPLVSFSLAYDRPYQLAPGDTLTLRYALVIFDGAIDRARLEKTATAVSRR